MKTLFLLALTLTGTAAQADSFQCRATGYDKNHFIQTIDGQYMREEYNAKQSALTACRARGWTGCYIISCRRWP